MIHIECHLKCTKHPLKSTTGDYAKATKMIMSCCHNELVANVADRENDVMYTSWTRGQFYSSQWTNTKCNQIWFNVSLLLA